MQKQMQKQELEQQQMLRVKNTTGNSHREGPVEEKEDEEMSKSALVAFRVKEEEIERKKMEVREKMQAQMGRVQEETRRLAEIREELEGMADPMRKEVAAVRKKIDTANRELKPLGYNCQKKYEKAASILSNHDPPIILAKVDADEEINKGLAGEFVVDFTDFHVDAMENFVEEASVPVLTIFNKEPVNRPFVTKLFNNPNAKIKREIGTLKLLKHPNVVRLYEVIASKTKIYMVLEYVTGGELFDKIEHRTRLPEDEGRKLFQQLIDAVSYCHDKGVFHRDLKPENVRVDAKGNIKISDFGLSALPEHFRVDGLLHTTCGSPHYVAPEV